MESKPNLPRRSVILGGLMVGTSVAATLAMPKPQVTSSSQLPDLERLVPERFADWQIDRSIVPLAVSPEVAEKLGTIYDRTLARTYVDSHGDRVMLSIAYGATQSRALQLHKPEVCYAAQGFRLSGLEKGRWQVRGADIPTMHMVGSLGSRVEPVTYWMRIGDDIARGWLEQNKVRLKYGTRGYIPDGVLFRISSISSDARAAYALQRTFVQDLIDVMPTTSRDVFLGAVAQGRTG